MNFKSNKKKLGGSIVIALLISVLHVFSLPREMLDCIGCNTSYVNFLYVLQLPVSLALIVGVVIFSLVVYIIWSLIEKK